MDENYKLTPRFTHLSEFQFADDAGIILDGDVHNTPHKHFPHETCISPPPPPPTTTTKTANSKTRQIGEGAHPG